MQIYPQNLTDRVTDDEEKLFEPKKSWLELFHVSAW